MAGLLASLLVLCTFRAERLNHSPSDLDRLRATGPQLSTLACKRNEISLPRKPLFCNDFTGWLILVGSYFSVCVFPNELIRSQARQPATGLSSNPVPAVWFWSTLNFRLFLVLVHMQWCLEHHAVPWITLVVPKYLLFRYLVLWHFDSSLSLGNWTYFWEGWWLVVHAGVAGGRGALCYWESKHGPSACQLRTPGLRAISAQFITFLLKNDL